MFTKGFVKIADMPPPPMPAQDAAQAVKKLQTSGGQGSAAGMAKGWANMKSELGGLFGSAAQNTGKMGG